MPVAGALLQLRPMPELNQVETQFDDYLFDVEEGGEAFAAPSRTDRSMILPSFVASPEYARLAPDDRELVWVQELVEAMESAAWDWRDLDVEMFEAVLLDGLGWAIDKAPADPARVARVLDAFLSFAGREYGAPHAADCCTYLRSPGVVDDIARWLRPFEVVSDGALLAELSAPYNWCDARCDRCPLAASCPVNNFDDPRRGRVAESGGDPEVNRAVALATAHALAAREGLAVDDSRRERPNRRQRSGCAISVARTPSRCSPCGKPSRPKGAIWRPITCAPMRCWSPSRAAVWPASCRGPEDSTRPRSWMARRTSSCSSAWWPPSTHVSRPSSTGRDARRPTARRATICGGRSSPCCAPFPPAFARSSSCAC